MQSNEVLDKLKSMGSAKDKEGMGRFGINVDNALGISVTRLRAFAKEIPKDHKLSLDLWASGIHEARILAIFVEEKEQVAEEQLESWVKDFDSWDIVDLTCGQLFDKTPWAWKKAEEWTTREETFVKRSGFVLMATLAVHDKKADDADFLKFFPILKREATDERNFVKKSVNWALRQMGKRSVKLNNEAIKWANEINEIDSKAAHWIAKDALRELQSDEVQERLKKKK